MGDVRHFHTSPSSSILTAVMLLAGCTSQGGLDGIGPGEAYEPVSEFLVEPALAADFAVECADFWTAARDAEYGGYHSFVGRDGQVTDDRRKSLVGQSRNAYGFARAFMLTGDTDYLVHAEHALAFLVASGWDAEHGGWFFGTDEQGELAPLFGDDWDPNSFKWSFTQHYALVGIAALCEATRSDEACGWLGDGMDVLDEQLWDGDAEHYGYHTEADLDWSEPSGKGFTPTVDGVTTHALAAYLLDGEDAHRSRLLQLADNMAVHLAGSVDRPEVALGFPEVFDSEWGIDYTATVGQPGHVLKTAWALARAHGVDPDAGYLDAAALLADDMLGQGGYDHDHGGPFHEYDWSAGRVTSTDKVYWVLEQGAVAGLLLYHLWPDPIAADSYLQMADESLAFYATYLIDPEYGETYSQVSFDGGEITIEDKGDAFKAGYHSIELGYTTYLYGNLLLLDRPATLYYAFEPSDLDRQIPLEPIAVESDTLTIVDVQLDGTPYDRYDPSTRTLDLPAGTGGTFAVAFER